MTPVLQIIDVLERKMAKQSGRSVVTGVKLTDDGKLEKKPARMNASLRAKIAKGKGKRVVSKAKAAAVKAQRP